MRRILFGFLAFDLFALVIMNSLGPFSFNVGQTTISLALPWQSTTILDVPAEARVQQKRLPQRFAVIGFSACRAGDCPKSGALFCGHCTLSCAGICNTRTNDPTGSRAPLQKHA